MTGPPRIKVAKAPANLEVWCDDDSFAERVFSDKELTERTAIAVVGNGDMIELRAHTLVVEVSLNRFESTYAALFVAWHTAVIFLERLGLAFPSEGELRLVDGIDVYSD